MPENNGQVDRQSLPAVAAKLVNAAVPTGNLMGRGNLYCFCIVMIE
jgi:hypothetical protein